MAVQWLNDEYTITAADVAAATWFGRGFNWRTRAWETITGTEISRSVLTPHRLRSAHVILYEDNTKAKLLHGRYVQLYTVMDPAYTSFKGLLLDAPTIEGCVQWYGDYPIPAGLLWRVRVSGLDENHHVVITVGYQ